MFFRRCFSLLLVVVLTTSARPQTEAVRDSAPTFKSNVQVVLLDVVVTDHNGQPIKELPSTSFEVFENGKQQTIASFEESHGYGSAPVSEPPILPPHSYTNATADPPGAINVLLLDGLNTPSSDQANVRRQMVEYLKSVEPGPRMAIFTLGSKLRMVEGFTDDPYLLLYALRKRARNPNVPMSRTPAEERGEQTVLSQMAEGGGQNPGAPPGMLEALARFQSEMAGTERNTTISLTLHALQELSRYLGGFHGRKNVIWFSGSFPRVDFPSGGDRTQVDSNNGLAEEMRQTINMLAAAQVAVYPISAEGLQPQALYQAESLTPRAIGGRPGEETITGPNTALQQESVARYSNQKSAEDIASNTGGQAFYNTNGLKDALAEVVHKGSYYYRISYSPTDKRMMGRYRRIQVKVKKGAYATPGSVFYRHGYYEQTEKQLERSEQQNTDVLAPLMAHSLPNATEIIYQLHLVSSAMHPKPGMALVGDNKDLHGDLTRYSADFVVPVDSLTFDTDQNGVRHGNIELALVAYDDAGNSLNWMFRFIKTSLKPELYPALQATGVRLHEEIDIPNGGTYLRAGFFDVLSNKSGTFELPLSKVTAAEPEKVAAHDEKMPSATEAALPGHTESAAAESPRFKLMPEAEANPAIWQALTSSPSSEKMKEALPADVPDYCAKLAGSGEHSQALESICKFAFAVSKKLPDVICDRETKRYRDTPGQAERMLNNLARGKPAGKDYFDVVAAKVAYLNGREYYDKVRINGMPVDQAAPWRAGTWSIGEFSSILVSIFLPSSKPDLQFEKEELLHSVPALVFTYHVAAQNNKSYFLSSDNRIWFPEYSGRLWLEKNTFRLLRLQRETPHMPDYPIRRATTEIQYSNVALGDGSSLVLPSASTSLVCSRSPGYCGVNLIGFSGWQTFRATSNIVLHPAN
jgi:VWFA-related protein